MARYVFELPCPCCGKRIEIDTRSGKARAVRFEESKKGKDLDGLVEEHRHEDERLASLFDEARTDVSKQEERLEDAFKRAAREAEKHKDEKPPNPFDWE